MKLFFLLLPWPPDCFLKTFLYNHPTRLLFFLLQDPPHPSVWPFLLKIFLLLKNNVLLVFHLSRLSHKDCSPQAPNPILLLKTQILFLDVQSPYHNKKLALKHPQTQTHAPKPKQAWVNNTIHIILAPTKRHLFYFLQVRLRLRPASRQDLHRRKNICLHLPIQARVLLYFFLFLLIFLKKAATNLHPAHFFSADDSV